MGSFAALRSLVPFVVVLAAACATSPAPRPRPTVDSTTGIEWRSFSQDAFDRARRENKLVLVDAGIEGCTACRWMYERTYRNVDVVRRVRDHFVAVAVDADVEPDLGARYLPWGWPATIVLESDGTQVAAFRGSMPPAELIAVLDDLARRHAEGTLTREGEVTSGRPGSPPGPLHDACVRVTTAIDREMDSEHGGWPGGGPQFIDGDEVEEALRRAHMAGEPAQRAQALRTLDGYARLLDPVWGGIFVGAIGRDFSQPIVEKRVLHEAAALRGFATAYAVSGERRWLERAREIDRYLDAFLRAPDGTFYSTQQDAAPNLPEGMSPRRYYELGDADRRRYGIPPVDHGVYTDQNGVVITAYASLYEATGNAEALTKATRAANAILAARLFPDGHVAQATESVGLASDERKRAFRPRDAVFLAAQAHFGRALVAMHRATGDDRWLVAAKRIATAMLAKLEDGSSGGFFASEARGAGPAFTPDKPIPDNIAAVRFLQALGVDAHDESLERAAERALRWLVSVARPTASLLLAIQDVAIGPVEMSVVGTRDDPAAVALFGAALRAYEPRKALHFDTMGRYPKRADAALFVCTREACSSPVRDPRDLVAIAAAFARSRTGVCP